MSENITTSQILKLEYKLFELRKLHHLIECIEGSLKNEVKMSVAESSLTLYDDRQTGKFLSMKATTAKFEINVTRELLELQLEISNKKMKKLQDELLQYGIQDDYTGKDDDNYTG